MSREDPQLRVRIPERLKERIEEKAKANRRTLTAEIVDRLEETVLQDDSVQDHAGYKNMVALMDEAFEESRLMYKKYSIEKSVNHVSENREKICSAIEQLLDALTPPSETE